MKANHLMNTRELAEYLGMDRQSIYQLIHQNKIPYMKPAGKLFFDRVEIEKWLQDSKREVKS